VSTSAPMLTATALSTEQRCPVDAEGTLEDLGFLPQERLVVLRTGAPSEVPWSLVQPDGTVMDVRWPSGGFWTGWTSPDGRWLAFVQGAANNEMSTVWVSSIDASVIRSVPISDHLHFALRWVTNESLLLLEVEGYYPVTYGLIYPFEPRVVPAPEVYLDFGLYAASPDGSELIYLAGLPGQRSLHKVDLNTGSDVPVLTWFDANRVSLPFFSELHWVENRVTVAYMDGEVLEVAQVNPVDLQADVALVSSIRFDDQTTSWGFNGWTDGILLPFYRVRGSYELDQTGPTRSLMLDLRANMLVDYCLEEQGLLPGAIESSADGRLLAWTQVRDGQVGIVVLDPASGAWSWLSDMELVGWGQLTS
jgi:hypothetical protein